jgi:hypothetical protein
MSWRLVGLYKFIRAPIVRKRFHPFGVRQDLLRLINGEKHLPCAEAMSGGNSSLLPPSPQCLTGDAGFLGYITSCEVADFVNFQSR